MGKARSPRYPSIGLKEAVEKITAIYNKDYQNPIPRSVAAKHMGYDSLHGKALGVLSTLAKFGLLEGRGAENRVSDLGMAIIAHPVGSKERVAALREAASKPDLFAEIDKRFNSGKGSDSAIRSYLLTQKFIPGAADLAIRSYRETKQLVTEESGGYIEPASQENPMNQQNMSQEAKRLLDLPPSLIKPLPATAPMLQEVFNLNEGPVTLIFPSNLSPESYEEMKDALELVLRRARRRSVEIPPMGNMEQDAQGVWKPKGQ